MEPKYRVGEIVLVAFRKDSALGPFKKALGKIVSVIRDGMVLSYYIYFFNEEIREKRYNKNIEWNIHEEEITCSVSPLKKFLKEKSNTISQKESF